MENRDSQEEHENLLCFDAPIVPGLNVCARCSSDLSEILRGNAQYKDILPLCSDEILYQLRAR